MEEIATVVNVFDNKLRLSFTRQLLCQKCGACHKSENGTMYLELENTIGANVGDRVLVRIEPANLKISSILYGIPSLLFVVGIFTGYFFWHCELFAFFTGFVFLVISFLVAKSLLKKYKLKIEKEVPKVKLKQFSFAEINYT